MIKKTAYDTLCDKLEPYVIPTLSTISERELADYAIEEVQRKAALKKLLKEEEPDKATRKALEDELLPIFDAPDPYTLNIVQIKVRTELIAVSWSEALRWAYKEQGGVQLRDYLLPENLGRAEAAWNSNLNRFGLSQEQIENLLRTFGQKEISESLELPWGGSVRRVGDNYELRGPKQID